MSLNIENKIHDLLIDLITDMGYELVGIEYINLGKNNTLRIYIDHEDGIDIDDCVEVSRQVNSILDVEDVISATYNLEVSSPGLDRPLFTIDHYQRFIQETIELQLRIPVENQRKWKGKLVLVDDNLITIEIKDKKEQTFAFANIKKANIVPKF